MYKVLIIGSGGREHAIVSSFLKSSRVDEVYVAPGNPGMLLGYEDYYSDKQIPVTLIDKTTIPEICSFVSDNKIEIVFVGPEQSLADGLADELENLKVSVIGPKKEGARLEASKIYAKKLMKKYGIPTADFQQFDQSAQAKEYLQQVAFPVVIKADGLAAGKGVVIANDYNQALESVEKIMEKSQFGNAGDKIIIEEFLTGWEGSIFAVTDGHNYKSTIVSQDYKKLLENDKGPNTGGMGAVAPVAKAEPHLQTIEKTVFDPLFKALANEHISYKGFLYAGLIFTDQGPKVLEFNCRLGDPEAQVILPLLDNDIIEICEAINNNSVDDLKLKWKNKYAANIVLASQGYPGKYEKGLPIEINEDIFNDPEVSVYYAGVRDNDDGLETAGGRVLSVTALAEKMPDALKKAYANIKKLSFKGQTYRKDIGINAK